MSSRVTRSNQYYEEVEDITIQSGAAGSRVNVESTSASTALTLRGGSGDGTFSIGSPYFGLEYIRRSVAVTGGGDGFDRVILDDRAAALTGQPITYSLTNATLFTGGSSFTFLSGALESLAVHTSNGPDYVQVSGTGMGLPVTVNAGEGDDTFDVRLNLPSPLAVAGGLGFDKLITQERFWINTEQSYVITATSVQNTAMQPVTYAELESLEVNAANFPNTFHVQGTAAGAFTQINGGNDNDQFIVTDQAVTLNSVAGQLHLDGKDGTANYVRLNDSANTVAQTYTMYVVGLYRAGAGADAPITFGNVQAFDFYAGRGDDQFNVMNTPAGVNMSFNLGEGNDTFAVGNATVNLDWVPGVLGVNGGAGTNSLIVNDQATQSSVKWTRSATQIIRERSDGVNQYRTQIDHANMQNVVINGGHGANTLQGTAAGGAAPLTMILPAGAAGYDDGAMVTTDAAGNIYTVGYFQGTVDFDPGLGVVNLTATGQYDSYLVKYSSTGNFLWARHLSSGTGQDNFGWDVKVDGANSVYVTGAFSGTLTLGAATLTSAGQEDGFLAKLDSMGNVLWTRQLGGSGYDYISEVALDAAGNVHINGSFQNTATLAGRSLTSSGGSDGLVDKFNSTGVLQWTEVFRGAGDDYPWGIAVDATGNVYTSGNFTGTLRIDSRSLRSLGATDGYLAKLNRRGQVQWTKQLGGTGDDSLGDLDVDAAGNVYGAGGFQGTMTLGNSTLTSKGGVDNFVTKLNGAGRFLWSRSMGSSANDWGNVLEVDAAGNTYYTGWFTGAGSFEGQATTAATYTGFLGKLDTAGNTRWTQVWGNGSGGGWGYRVAIDGFGHIYVAGGFDGTADQDPGRDTFTMTSAGIWDAAVYQFTEVAGRSVAASAMTESAGFAADKGPITVPAVDGVTGLFFGNTTPRRTAVDLKATDMFFGSDDSFALDPAILLALLEK